MKKVLCLMLVLMMLLGLSVTINASDVKKFSSFEVKHCYSTGDTIYADVSFEEITDGFKLIMAAYNSDDALCSVKSFDISETESFYELDMAANGGKRVRLLLWDGISGLRPLCEVFAEVVDKGILYPSSSPMMIVTSRVLRSNGEVYLKGYMGTSYALLTVYVDAEATRLLPVVGKGDIIRYVTNNSNEIIDYQVWYDADKPLQQEGCNTLDDAIAKRILEVNATSTTPVVNYPEASFRLLYGTVNAINLGKAVDTICVTPTIKSDSIDMAEEGNGVSEWEIESTVKVFEYADGNVLADADLKSIVPGQTEVIAYSSQGKLRMLYIVKNPYISEKKIMIVQKGVDTVDGVEITGYSEGEEVVYTVDAAKEPIIEEVYAGKIIAYVPDGDSIKDIEIVFSAPLKPFNGSDGESYIAEDTKESVVFGLVDYGTDSVTVNGVGYNATENTNYLLMQHITGGANKLKMGIGKHIEMKNAYVLIRVKADKPTEIADVVIFQGLN